MKIWCLFSATYKKNVNSLPSAELAQSVVKVNKSLSDSETWFVIHADIVFMYYKPCFTIPVFILNLCEYPFVTKCSRTSIVGTRMSRLPWLISPSF